MTIALCVHGHFYQPPRENPWTDEVPREPSAAPFHDWNARIHAECYRANAYARIHDADGRIESIVDNFEHLSFNFGPTLARWLARHDPAVAARLRDADAAQRRRLGAGGAVAQAYAHPILPLCNAADRRTQVAWGLADFRRRFGREAEGLWLPETAVSPETLETLIDLGVAFTILAPEQIAAVRAHPGDAWHRVDRDTLDTGRPYLWRHRDGSGRAIALAVFDGPLSRAVAFGDAASGAERLLDEALASGKRSKVSGPRLVLCASDGELWGHHKKFADLTLAFATHVEAARRGIGVTNLAAYLARHPPVWEAELAPGPDGEGTAWSCAHGVGRWRRDCGCNAGGGPGWNQAWRAPLREALDIVRDAAASFFEDAGGDLFWDPWGTRDAYGDVVDEPLPVRERLLLENARGALAAGSTAARSRAVQLCELQRATLLMYASCGWFFDDIAGLEASLILRIGAQALDALHEVGGTPPTEAVLDALAAARSNRKTIGTGADVFRRVAGDKVTGAHAIGRAALTRLVTGAVEDVPGFEVTLSGAPDAVGTFSGRGRARHRRSGTTEEATFVATADVPGAGLPEVHVGGRRYALAELGDETRGQIVMAILPSLLPRIGVPEIARVVIDAARALPPDDDTTAGVARRDALAEVALALLGDDGVLPGSDALRAAAQLLEIVRLPAGAPVRRRLEERVWALIASGRPGAPLRALAEGLGFSARERPSRTATG
jgi:hypothetical protein